jgi:hypothetical protein
MLTARGALDSVSTTAGSAHPDPRVNGRDLRILPRSDARLAATSSRRVVTRTSDYRGLASRQQPKLAVTWGFPLAGLHISLLPAARVIVTEVSQLASDNRRGESVGFARRTSGVTAWGLGLHLVVEQDQQSPTAGGSGWPAVISIVAVTTAAPRCRGLAGWCWAVWAEQDAGGDGGRYPVRSCADASGRAVRAVWRARRSGSGVRRCAVAARTSFTAVGRFTRQPGGRRADGRLLGCAPSRRRPCYGSAAR